MRENRKEIPGVALRKNGRFREWMMMKGSIRGVEDEEDGVSRG